MTDGGAPVSPFERWTDKDIVDLVDHYPLAWVVSAGGQLTATPLPMLIECDAAGRPVSLLGHFGRSNPQVAQLEADGRALFLFQGPQGYISPEWLSNKNWAPTWNYAIARIHAQVTFDETLNDEALERLVAHMEASRNEPWQLQQLGERYQRLKQGIIAFRAPITRIEGRFKLGQDEHPNALAQILAGLGEGPLHEWMGRFNDIG